MFAAISAVLAGIGAFVAWRLRPDHVIDGGGAEDVEIKDNPAPLWLALGSAATAALSAGFTAIATLTTVAPESGQ